VCTRHTDDRSFCIGRDSVLVARIEGFTGAEIRMSSIARQRSFLFALAAHSTMCLVCLGQSTQPISAEQTAQFLAQAYKEEPTTPGNIRRPLLEGVVKVGPAAAPVLEGIFREAAEPTKSEVLKHLVQLSQRHPNDTRPFKVLVRILADPTLRAADRYEALDGIDFAKDPRVDATAILALGSTDIQCSAVTKAAR
jgi:hypothetical protein